VQAIKAAKGFGITVRDEQILAAIGEQARGAGVFGEPAGATAYAGLKEAVHQKLVDPAWQIVVLNTGNGLKDVAAAMKGVGERGSSNPTRRCSRPCSRTETSQGFPFF